MSEKNKNTKASGQQAEPETDVNVEATAPQDDEIQSRIQQLEADLAKEKNDYLFLRADFDNYRKRMLKEREELVKNAAEKTLFALLPIVDDFERGLQATRDINDENAVRQGMELIYNKLIKYLADNGVTAMESTGTAFDADLHEAIATIPAPADDLKGKIIDTTQRGYIINGKVLRHAKVVVGE
jgi:molecular chaperone GrpE